MLLSEFPLMEKPFIKAQIKSLAEHYDDSTVIILSAKEKTILQGSLSMQSDFLRDEFTASSVLDPDGESYELMKSELFYAGHIMECIDHRSVIYKACDGSGEYTLVSIDNAYYSPLLEAFLQGSVKLLDGFMDKYVSKQGGGEKNGY